MTTALQTFGRGLADAVFPPVCVDCGGLVEGGPLRHVCARCAPLISRVTPPHCATCGHPFYGEVGSAQQCEHCAVLEPAYREGRTVVLLKGPARALIHELKYHRGLHVLADIATLAGEAEHVMELVRGAVLVPVPLHPRKERQRGFNQAALIAGVLARSAGGGTCVVPLLRRVTPTVSQTHFDRATRRENLKNAFAIARGAAPNPSQHYVLIDDVFTTGSTLNACARELRRVGCLNLDVVTFGHG